MTTGPSMLGFVTGISTSALALGPARKVITGVMQSDTNIPNDKEEMMQRDSSILHNMQEHGTPTATAPPKSATPTSHRKSGNVGGAN